MKFIFAFALLLQLSYTPVHAQESYGETAVRAQVLLSAVLVTGAGTGVRPFPVNKTFQAYGNTGSGSGAATIKIQGSDVPVPTANDWVDLGTITLVLGTTSTTDGFANASRWEWVRANVTAISGTGANVTATMGY